MQYIDLVQQTVNDRRFVCPSIFITACISANIPRLKIAGCPGPPSQSLVNKPNYGQRVGFD